MISKSKYLSEIFTNKESISTMQIVFVDIVKYSKRNTKRQLKLIDCFTKLIEKSIEDTSKEYFNQLNKLKINFKGDILKLPTGDGIAIGLPFDWLNEIHLDLSIHILNEIEKLNNSNDCLIFKENHWCNCHNSLNIRIGIAKGEVILFKDINNNYNIAGKPINMAARVMDIADLNQIFFTEEAYDSYIEMNNDSLSANLFRKYEEKEIKHNLFITTYQYINSNVKSLNTDINVENKDSNKVKIIKLEELSSILPDLPEFVEIFPSSFIMGNDKFGKRLVKITKAFSISISLITQKLYQYIMIDNPSDFPGENLPVENITWYGAIKFCNKLSKKCNLLEVYEVIENDIITINVDADGFRLPTEAEWEYSCLGGSTDELYGELKNIAWYNKNSKGHTRAIKSKKENYFGIYDILGNVWEWCYDGYNNYSNNEFVDPIGSLDSSKRVIRGGSWASFANIVNAKFRGKEYPNKKSNDIGFRVVKQKKKII